MSWPPAFLQDMTYSILRPLYDSTSKWRNNLEIYLMAKARQLGGVRVLQTHFKLLSFISTYSVFNNFLLSPFNNNLDLPAIFKEMTLFLQERFMHEDPWFDLPEKKKFLKNEKSKYPDYASTDIIQTALLSCPELTHKPNCDLVYHMFQPSCNDVSIHLEHGYTVATVSVLLGGYYTNTLALDALKERKFYSLLGNYARWDDAKILIFKNDLNQYNLFSMVRVTYKLRGIGELKTAKMDGEDYYLMLLIDSDLLEKAFFISNWELNTFIVGQI